MCQKEEFMTPEPLQKQKIKHKLYILHCDTCGFHKKTDGSDIELIEIKRTQIQGGIPKIQDGKTIPPKYIEKSKMFHCPKCGKGIVAHICNIPIMKHEEENDNQKNNITRCETSPFGQTLPGLSAD